MPAWWLWVRTDARRRWRPAVVLMLLVALAGGAVLAAVAGGRRNGSAYERLVALTSPAELLVLPNDPGFDWDRVRAMPDVAVVGEFPVTGFFVESHPELNEAVGFPPGSPEAGTEVEVPVAVEGRLADPDRYDEVTVGGAVAKAAGVEVGDTVTLAVPTREAMTRAFDGEGEPTPEGAERVDVTVVGIAKGSFFGDALTTTYAFYRRYEERLVPENGYVNALVKLRSGAAGTDAFRRDLAELAGHPVEVKDQTADARRATNATHFERDALYAFALAAALAVLVLVGQAVVRMTSASAAEAPLLAALGFTRAGAAAAIAALPAAALAAGAVLAAAVAWLASGRFPIGVGRQVEPHPGRHADWSVLAPGTALILAVSVAGTLAVAHLALRRRHRGAPDASRLAATVGAAGAPVPLALGARLALERGDGRNAVPVRPALVGAVVGVAGVVGALTFAHGLDRAAADRALFGQPFDAITFVVAEMPPEDALGPAVDRSDVEMVATVRNVIVSVGGRDLSVFGVTELKGTYGSPTLRGRMPVAADEVALSPADMRALGVAVGDRVTVDGTGRTLTVTGEALSPELAHTSYDGGAVMTGAGVRRLVPDDEVKFGGAVVRFVPGTDVDAAMTGLNEDGSGLVFESPIPLWDQRNLHSVRRLPVGLGAFLGVLAVGAVGHALASTVRRRRHDLAVLRALGMTRRQARATVAWQATTLATVGLALGLPVGVAAGRLLWQVVAENTPIIYVAPLALVALVLVPPAAVLVCNGIAAWPGHVAARMRPAESLQAE